MLQMIGAGLFLCIGFWIGKKITNSLDYHTYMQGEKVKEKLVPKVTPLINNCIGSVRGAYNYHKENWKKKQARKHGA